VAAKAPATPTPATSAPAPTAPPDLLDLRLVQIVVAGERMLRELIRLDLVRERLWYKGCCARGGDCSSTCGGHAKRELEKTAAIHDPSSDVPFMVRIS
jgi:hypothetical protein